MRSKRERSKFVAEWLRTLFFLLCGVLVLALSAQGQSANPAAAPAQNAEQKAEGPPAKTHWQYGGFVDAGYLLDFNHPDNDLFRGRGTTPRVDEAMLNMALLYIRKEASPQSHWGVEVTLQAGEDSKLFGFSATAPNFPGANWLRHLGPTNLSYLLPVGKGLTLQGGYFNSLIGYDSLYAKNNFNYTRPWGADFTPYLMFGLNAAYSFSDKLSAVLFVVNGYWHLANANAVPSSGGQLSYKATNCWSLKQTVLYGPHQSNTSFKFWRILSDSIAEWKAKKITTAVEYQFSQEKVDAPGEPRAIWMSAQWPVHWAWNDHWSFTLRPEVAWDRNGRWTSSRQTIKALTSTLEYRVPYRRTTAMIRFEHRFDDSRGPNGGFFRGRQVSPGPPSLTPAQHLLVIGIIVAFDSATSP